MKMIMIVESPNKIKKVKEYCHAIGLSDIDVMASVGHIRDLPKNEIGVDLSNFAPTYQVSEDKKNVVSKLKKSIAESQEVYLATDPDREGESIAWHLYEALSLRSFEKNGGKVYRIKFNEINKKAIQDAMSSRGKIDMLLVKAQEGRRVLDRLIGYCVSPRLVSVDAKSSAGRVQSPALRLIVDRESEINQFKPVHHFDVKATHTPADNPQKKWHALWDHKNYRQQNQPYWTDEDAAKKIASVTKLTALSVEKKKRSAKPPAPFSTSSLQQVASSVLKFSPGHTMKLAQNLNAQGGITYHRTDNLNLSDQSNRVVIEYLKNNNLPFVDTPNKWESKKNAQEAHEAIRPVDIDQPFFGETEDEQKLYDLIRKRVLLCQMPDAIFDVTDIVFEGNVSVSMADGKLALFKSHGERITDQKGWMGTVYFSGDTNDAVDDEDEHTQELPQIIIGDIFDVKGEVVSKKTSPPSRYTEAGLIKKLESIGIGRPSTYASIIENIKARDYVVVNKKRQMEPTNKGIKIIEFLKDHHFSFVEYNYTTILEERLDAISLGQDSYSSVVSSAYKTLEGEINNLPPDPSREPRIVSSDMHCKCGGGIDEDSKSYRCIQCKATVWKIIAGRETSKSDAKILFSGDETDVLEGFTSKSQSLFSAKLKIIEGKLGFVFPEKQEGENSSQSSESNDLKQNTCEFKCQCGGKILLSQKYWKCLACGSTVWKIMSGHETTDEEAKNLFKGEMIRLTGLTSSKGTAFDANAEMKDLKVKFSF